MAADDPSRSARPGRRPIVRELGAFGVVGALCFAVDLALFQLLYAGAGADPVIAKLVATLLSVTLAFFGHRHWSFAHRPRSAVGLQYGQFVLVNVVTLALGLAVVGTAHHGFGIDGALALQLVNVGSVAVGTLIRFLVYRHWVFAPGRRATACPSERDAVSR